MMHDIINAVLNGIHDLLLYMRSTTIAEWGESSVSLYTAAVSLLIFERILAVFFAVVSRFSEDGVK